MYRTAEVYVYSQVCVVNKSAFFSSFQENLFLEQVIYRTMEHSDFLIEKTKQNFHV